MMSKKASFIYECVVPPTPRGRGSVEIPYHGPMNQNEWPDPYTPKFGLHVLRLQGPYETVDRFGRARRQRGDCIVTARPVGKHLTEQHTKAVSRSLWASGTNPKQGRYKLTKTVEPKLQLLTDEEAAEARPTALYPEGEDFRVGKPFGSAQCHWHESLFVDQLGDTEPTEEMLRLAKNRKATLEDGLPPGAVMETAQ